tara:strand:- start:32 stop:316 length:285 start_codon:yes stop_codon:yes gene_type:complete
MLDKVRELLSTYKVHVMLVGGAVVVATAWGNCTFEPNEQSSNTTELDEAAEVTAVSGDASSTVEAVEATEATGTITGTVEGVEPAETTETEVTE